MIILLLPLLFLMLLIFAIGSDEDSRKEANSNHSCEVMLMVEDVKLTEVRGHVRNNLLSEDLDLVVLAIYKHEGYQNIDAIIEKINQLYEYVVDHNYQLSKSEYIQSYKHGKEYITKSEENQKEDMSYIVDVVKGINKNCSVTSADIDLESEHYQGSNPYVASNLKGQCTWFVWGRVHEKTGYALPSKMGDANNWYAYAKSNRILSVGTKPKANSIMVLGGGDFGHVAIIESIESGKVRITEGNYNNPYANDDKMASYAREHYADLFHDGIIDISVLESGSYQGMQIKGYIYF